MAFKNSNVYYNEKVSAEERLKRSMQVKSDVIDNLAKCESFFLLTVQPNGEMQIAGVVDGSKVPISEMKKALIGTFDLHEQEINKYK